MLYYLEKETSEFYNKNAEKFDSPKNEILENFGGKIEMIKI